MGGLILKDYYVLLKQSKIFVLMIVMFALVPNGSLSSFAIMYASMLPITALAYDERSKWDRLAAMMPYTGRQIVLCKYVTGYGATLVAAVICFIGKVGYGIITGTPASGEELVLVPAVVVMAFIIQAVNLPLMFKLGTEKGRVIFIIITVVAVIGTVTLLDNIPADLNLTMIVIGIAAFAAVINIVSIIISLQAVNGRR